MLKATAHAHTLNFRFEAGTSRGTLREHTVYYIRIFNPKKPEVVGIGEAAPLKGLSIDYGEHFPRQVELACQLFSEQNFSLKDLNTFIPPELPSLRFAFETALLDFAQGGKKQIYKNSFSEGETALPINGLIWMGKPEFMQEQIERKISEGYTCIKMKIGAIDFEQELRLLEGIRHRFDSEQLTLRVDANGAFSPEEAPEKLSQLADLDLHSIEQPIAAGQRAEMRQLCARSRLPIALDEELIGVMARQDKVRLLDEIRPPFIILKPTLLGGLGATREWIELADAQGIGWWVTSALESNIGLNAISQFTAEYVPSLPQGLGTGQLYHNNVVSPLTVAGGEIRYLSHQNWGVVPAGNLF